MNGVFDGLSLAGRVAVGALAVVVAVAGTGLAAFRLPSSVGVVGALGAAAGTGVALLVFIETVGERQRRRDRERRRERARDDEGETDASGRPDSADERTSD